MINDYKSKTWLLMDNQHQQGIGEIINGFMPFPGVLAPQQNVHNLDDSIRSVIFTWEYT